MGIWLVDAHFSWWLSRAERAPTCPYISKPAAKYLNNSLHTPDLVFPHFLVGPWVLKQYIMFWKHFWPWLTPCLLDLDPSDTWSFLRLGTVDTSRSCNSCYVVGFWWCRVLHSPIPQPCSQFKHSLKMGWQKIQGLLQPAAKVCCAHCFSDENLHHHQKPPTLVNRPEGSSIQKSYGIAAL